MPKSLKIIKELSEHSIQFNAIVNLHYYDLLSIIYSLRIDDAKRYLKSKGQENLNNKGIASVKDVEGADILKYFNN